MIIKSANFIKSATEPSHYLISDLPEIAFAGRSNVGKSSLINTLVNQKHLVKTSSTPGKTQTINFFVINDTFSFVDLPGYGYAKVSQATRKKWGPMVETYLKTRTNLKAVVLLIDIRRIPGIEELNFIDWLKFYNIPCILILTKADKLSKNKQIIQEDKISQALSVNKEELILFSAKTRLGRDKLWAKIKKIMF